MPRKKTEEPEDKDAAEPEPEPEPTPARPARAGSTAEMILQELGKIRKAQEHTLERVERLEGKGRKTSPVRNIWGEPDDEEE